MGSLRNPIGPLPSTIYWRRRAVAATLIALLALLVVWAVTNGGGKGNHDDSRAPGSGPVNSITPGPSGSGPAISEQPGGRDESGDTGGSGGSGGGSSDAGSGGTGDGTGDSGNGADTEAGSGTGGGSGGATAGQQLPPGSSLPDCAPAALRLTLKTELRYGPGQKPKFRLIATNTSSTACKADFGPKSAVLTVTEAAWRGRGGVVLQGLPARRGRRAAEGAGRCDRRARRGVGPREERPEVRDAPAGAVGAGTYLVEAKAPGEPVQRASFVLAKD